jgi:hypothetical protein
MTNPMHPFKRTKFLKAQTQTPEGRGSAADLEGPSFAYFSSFTNVYKITL